MSRIVADENLGQQLAKVRETVEICTPDGRVLGRFMPMPVAATGAMLEPQVSQEELDRRARDEGGRPLKEIWADLEKRA